MKKQNITEVITPETREALKARRFVELKWLPDHGYQMDVTFTPLRKDGKKAARTRRHEVTVFHDRAFKGCFILMVNYKKNYKNQSYFHDRGLSAARVNEILLDFAE